MVELAEIRVATGSDDSDGRLVLRDGALVAVLVLLEDQGHGAARGRWNLEAGFDILHGMDAPLFRSLDEAKSWVDDQYGAAPRS